MTILNLHLLGSPVLRQRSVEVPAVDDEVRRFIDDLFETMYAARGVGLAANQVGVARRIAVVDAEGDRLVLVNPRIVEASGKHTAEEGCLSVPDLYADVTRPERVVLEALDRDGAPYRRELDGLAARAVQHEIDHLDGILFLDHLSLLKRTRLLARWKKEHERDPSYIREVKPASAGTP
ncbi:MAG TPA: peptide deformylase [Gemmatimonadales bacterium]|jgi:peptide deformylase|nr:peptide deformylase [Gemmatimonadales bacterium]